MMRKFRNLLAGAVLLSLFVFHSCSNSGGPAEQIWMPRLFSAHMVLQKNMPVPVWGTANPGGLVCVEFSGQTKKAVSGDDGRWEVLLDPLSAGGPGSMKIYGRDTTLIPDVMVGEVWICSGQSNMEWQVRNSNNAQQEMNDAHWPQIRMFTVQKKVSEEAQRDCQGDWEICNPLTVGDFSAVGYFFGRMLHQKLKVPVGLIHSSWGGTPAEAWTSLPTLSSDSILKPIVNRYEQIKKDYPQRLALYQEQLRKLQEDKERLPVYQIDEGNSGFKKGWADVHFDDHAWASMHLPGFWENTKDMRIDGAVWFRKEIQIPDRWADKPLVLSLGAIDDFDVSYFNGSQAGTTGEETPQFWTHQRVYEIPAGLVHPGRAVIAVRVFDHYGQGGFGGPGAVMKLALKSEPEMDPVLLAGLWQYKIEKKLDPSLISGPGGEGLPQEPQGPGHPHSPAGLYHAMIYPLAPFAVTGAVWYQGEANAGRAFQYRTLLPAMIKDWRRLWHQKDYYFGIVQLANFMAVSEEPQESNWAELREAQYLTAANDQENGLATIIDIGEADDIHPKNKQDVGKRLALWALAKCYGQDLVYSGPVYQSMSVETSKIRVTFKYVAEGLKTKNGTEPEGFTIAGGDKKFVRAHAKIEGNQVIVWSDLVKQPEAVRYAWADNPVCNLYNSAMLPAVPFRTDSYPGITLQNR